MNTIILRKQCASAALEASTTSGNDYVVYNATATLYYVTVNAAFHREKQMLHRDVNSVFHPRKACTVCPGRLRPPLSSAKSTASRTM